MLRWRAQFSISTPSCVHIGNNNQLQYNRETRITCPYEGHKMLLLNSNQRQRRDLFISNFQDIWMNQCQTSQNEPLSTIQKHSITQSFNSYEKQSTSGKRVRYFYLFNRGIELQSLAIILEWAICTQIGLWYQADFPIAFILIVGLEKIRNIFFHEWKDSFEIHRLCEIMCKLEHRFEYAMMIIQFELENYVTGRRKNWARWIALNINSNNLSHY